MPKYNNSKKYREYIKNLNDRLAANPYTEPEKDSISSEEYVKKSIEVLDKKADEIITDITEYIFVSTAISQNGVLDALIVLIFQIKMIWKLAHVYNQRPRIKEIVKLYINVAATALIVREIDDFELIEDQLVL